LPIADCRNYYSLTGGLVARIVYETIAEIADPAVMRVLISALRGYGFHPLDRDDQGIFGIPSLPGQKGAPVEVPEGEAADARALAQSLLADMVGGNRQ
jgi:hypothetical protein